MIVNIENIRHDFPILKREINGQTLVYLDNAATTQKPNTVIQAITSYYENNNANVYRSVHTLSGEATEAYEEAREKVRHFIQAKYREEVIFTKGTTDSLNKLSRSLKSELHKGDEILITYMEHHSNIVPWQELAKEKQAQLVYVKLTAEGRLDMDDFKEKLSGKTKIVAFTHVSNALGTINPVKEMTQLAHEKGAYVIIDGAQAVPHMPVDVQDIDADFYVFSGHKMLGPTGIGILYGKKELFEKMEPSEFGGEMIELVSELDSTWAPLPFKLEAGTPNIAGAIGLGAAIDYLEAIGMENVKKYEEELMIYLLDELEKIEGLEIYGPKTVRDRAGVVSFNLGGIHPHDLSTALDLDGIAIRAGHHCAQPLMRACDVLATSRASLYLYNTKEEITTMVEALKEAKEFFR